jgi:hypothetical protein
MIEGRKTGGSDGMKQRKKAGYLIKQEAREITFLESVFRGAFICISSEFRTEVVFVMSVVPY